MLLIEQRGKESPLRDPESKKNKGERGDNAPENSTLMPERKDERLVRSEEVMGCGSEEKKTVHKVYGKPLLRE